MATSFVRALALNCIGVGTVAVARLSDLEFFGDDLKGVAEEMDGRGF